MALPAQPTVVPPLAQPQLLPDTGYTRLRLARHGFMLYNSNDVYIARSLDIYGEFSEGECDVFRQILRPSDFVLDVGANIGAHTVFFAKTVGPHGAVIAFEPQRLVFQMLCANVALNNLTNVVCHQVAVGHAPGHVRVPVMDPNRINNFGALELGHQTDGETVPLVRLDSLQPPRLRLIKCDVEGMELPALQGAAGLIQKFRPALYVENDRPDKSADLIRFLDSLGYVMFWHTPPLYNPNNFYGNPENIFGDTFSFNMICVDRAKAATIANFRPVEVPKP